MKDFSTNKKSALLLGILLAALVVLFSGQTAYAAEDYTTPSYNIKAVVTENHVFKVTETITVDFGQSQHHGIMRYIPQSKGVYSVKNVGTGKDEHELTSEYSNGLDYILIRIGDPDEYVSGKKTYTITYELKCYEDTSKALDYLSYDMFPSGWRTSVGSMTSTLVLPKSVPWKNLKAYAGVYGSKDSWPSYLTHSVDKKTNTITIKGTNVPANAGVTIRGDLPEGYWVNPANRNFVWKLLAGILILIPLITLVLWVRFGRDPKIIKTVEFYPPEGMTPAEIGYIIDGVVDDKDVASMLMYYADKGYLKIHEYQRDRFELTKLQDIPETEKKFSRVLFQRIFRSGDTVRLDDMPSGFGDDLLATKSMVEGYYNKKSRRLYDSKADVCRGIGNMLVILNTIASVVLAAYGYFEIGIAFFVIAPVLIQGIGLGFLNKVVDKSAANKKAKTSLRLVLGAVLMTVGVLFGAGFIYILSSRQIVLTGLYVGSMVITIFFTTIMRARTKRAAAWMGQILGFRDFIKNAEYDRLKYLSDQDPEYFFNIMPYAYVMGLSTRWAKKFTKIKVQQPKWCSSYDASTSMLDAMWYGSMMRSYSGRIADTARAASIDQMKSDLSSALSSGGGDSGGGGFSGGGFSGGGFGGGGGGAW